MRAGLRRRSGARGGAGLRGCSACASGMDASEVKKTKKTKTKKKGVVREKRTQETNLRLSFFTALFLSLPPSPSIALCGLLAHPRSTRIAITNCRDSLLRANAHICQYGRRWCACVYRVTSPLSRIDREILGSPVHCRLHPVEGVPNKKGAPINGEDVTLLACTLLLRSTGLLLTFAKSDMLVDF